jgi:hypothetical protein
MKVVVLGFWLCLVPKTEGVEIRAFDLRGRKFQCQISIRWQTSNRMKVENLVTVVTGASQGLGKAIAREFVKEGAHVALCARDEKLIDVAVDDLKRAARESRAFMRASEVSDGITGKLINARWDPWENLHAFREQLANSDIYTLRRIVPEDRGLKFV